MKRLLILLAACSSPEPPRAWITNEAAGIAMAQSLHKGIVFDFFASWSMPSAASSRVLDSLARELDEGFVRVRIDVSYGDDNWLDDLRRRYSDVLPAVVFVGVDGKIFERNTGPLDEKRSTRTNIHAAIARLRER